MYIPGGRTLVCRCQPHLHSRIYTVVFTQSHLRSLIYVVDMGGDRGSLRGHFLFFFSSQFTE